MDYNIVETESRDIGTKSLWRIIFHFKKSLRRNNYISKCIFIPTLLSLMSLLLKLFLGDFCLLFICLDFTVFFFKNGQIYVFDFMVLNDYLSI